MPVYLKNKCCWDSSLIPGCLMFGHVACCYFLPVQFFFDNWLYSSRSTFEKTSLENSIRFYLDFRLLRYHWILHTNPRILFFLEAHGNANFEPLFVNIRQLSNVMQNCLLVNDGSIYYLHLCVGFPSKQPSCRPIATVSCESNLRFSQLSTNLSLRF